MILRAMLLGAVLTGGLGGLVGLAVGLAVHPPTAWFAVLEIGVPAGLLGCLLGLAVGVVAAWIRRRRTPVDDDFAGTPTGW